MTTLTLSEVKARLSEIADEVATTHRRVQVTRNGREYVVLLAAEDLASIEATLELLSDPEAMARVRSAEQDIEHGACWMSPLSGNSCRCRDLSELSGRRDPNRCAATRRTAPRIGRGSFR